MNGLTIAILAGAFGAAVVSGALGMAGGMLLMAVLGLLLPVRLAMVVHGVTQLASNFSRLVLLRRHARTGIIGPYLLGALAAALAFRTVAAMPSRATMLAILGLLPFLGLLADRRLRLDPLHPPTAACCGLLNTSAQLLCGVSGPILDVFFLRSDLSKEEVVATKALTQVFGHALKLTYFLSLATSPGPTLPWLIFPGVVLAALGGTWAGRGLLRRLSEERFRSLGGNLVLLTGGLLLVRAARLAAGA